MLSQSEYTRNIEELCSLSGAYCQDQWIIRKQNQEFCQNSTWVELNEFILDKSTCTKYRRVSSICYSETYNVPVYWFNFYDIDGRLVPIENFKCFAFVKEFRDDFIEFISQAEHPFLGIAFYNLHPCKTAELMKPLKTRNYVLSFISTLGSIFITSPSNWPMELFSAGLMDKCDKEAVEQGMQTDYKELEDEP